MTTCSVHPPSYFCHPERSEEFHPRESGTYISYLAHLLSVAALVLEDGGDEGEAIGALLRDAVEDQGGKQRREAIRRQFGDRVARIVDGCTDADMIPNPAWRERKGEVYRGHGRPGL